MSEKKSVFLTILDNGIEALQRPFVVNKVKRAFESAKDSLEEQIITLQSTLMQERESLVSSAKGKEALSEHMNLIVQTRISIQNAERALEALKAEKAEFLA